MRRLGLLGLYLILAGCSVASPAADPSTSANTPADGLPSGAKVLDINADAGDCIGSQTDRLAVLGLARGADFHAILPGAEGTPELDAVGNRVVVVVYRDGWPGPVTGRFQSRGRERDPGTWEVCVRRADGEPIAGLPFIVYGNIRSAGSRIAVP